MCIHLSFVGLQNRLVFRLSLLFSSKFKLSISLQTISWLSVLRSKDPSQWNFHKKWLESCIETNKKINSEVQYKALILTLLALQILPNDVSDILNFIMIWICKILSSLYLCNRSASLLWKLPETILFMETLYVDFMEALYSILNSTKMQFLPFAFFWNNATHRFLS